MTLLLMLACGPKKAPAGPTTDSLAGSTWTMRTQLTDLGLQEYPVTLEPGGVLRVHNERDTTYGNDHWSYVDGVLTLTMNESYVTYSARFVEGEWQGSAANVREESWDFRMTPD